MLATQTLIQKKAKNMRVTVDGTLPAGVTAKDIILAIIGEIGTAGGTGHVIEFAGEAIRDLSMEGRMTVCNMTIEGGARAGLIAPDEKTFDYLKAARKRRRAPTGTRRWTIGRPCTPTTTRHFDADSHARCRVLAADRHLGIIAGRRGFDQRHRAEPGRYRRRSKRRSPK